VLTAYPSTQFDPNGQKDEAILFQRFKITLCGDVSSGIFAD